MTAGNPTHAERLKAAADWYAELREPDLAPETFDHFQAWEADPANAAAFAEIERTLVVTDRTRFGREAADARAARPGRRRLQWVAALGGLAAVLIVGISAVALWSPAQPADPVTYLTDLGEIREVTLSDGSVVTLNTSTRIEIGFGDKRRLVEFVEGEALFDVVKEERPFIVVAGGSRTEALGTRFGVRSTDGALAVTLVEGSVRVAASGAETGRVLAPGQQLLRAADGGVKVSDVDPASLFGWQDGRVEFDNTPLSEAIAQMNRYSATKIRIDGEDLASQRISGTFPAGEQEDFASSLELFLPLRAETSAGAIRLVPAED